MTKKLSWDDPLEVALFSPEGEIKSIKLVQLPELPKAVEEHEVPIKH